MSTEERNHEDRRVCTYLTPLGAWALAFGCAVGWGAFVMPGNTFLPIAGPVGTALGLGLGAAVMLLLAANYHYLMNRFPGCGGAYTFTKRSFGYDHGFVSAWFLIITYVAIIWANATALPLIVRTLMGSAFQFGFHYVIAGYHVYMGEILLAAGALLIAALLCLQKKLSEKTQIIMAILLFGGVVVCFAAARAGARGTVFEPGYAPTHSKFGGVFTIFALTPWAFVGFESISHSSEEVKFPLKRSFVILSAAVVTAGLAYILLVLLAVTALPEGCASWLDYVNTLGERSGLASQPTFYAAHRALGNGGTLILGTAALCGIFTGLIGNYIALSRLLKSISDDGMLPGWVGECDENCVPRRAILSILAVSVVLPFFGRTAISWIVDVTTVGATIAYAYASAAAWKNAREEKNRLFTATGIAGFIVSLLFAAEFLIPNLTDVKTLSMESYFILAAWGILGLVFFRWVFRRDKERRFGRSVIVWVVLLALIIYASSVWTTEATDAAIDQSVAPIQNYYTEKFTEAGMSAADDPGAEYMRDVLEQAKAAHTVSDTVHMVLIIFALIILFDIYYQIQKREKQIEVEKVLAEEASRAKTSFLSNMSHEIRTPMNAIIGLDNIALRNPNLQPQTREQLEKIGASAKHLLGLINDILDMSRIESGRMVLKNEEFSFREFLDQINIIINGQCQDKGLHYECQIVGRVGDYYFGDDMKLKQVLINILGNSVKFTDAPGDVTLTVEQLAREADACTMRFVMRDTGIGMDKAFIPKLFEAFSQEDATSTNRYGGSGLGMAITKNFVEMMNGDIHVDSEKGVGSVFTVTVTLGASDRQAQAAQGIDLPENLRALVVDDDEIACEHGRIVLQSIGIEADTAASGSEGLAALRGAHDRGRGYDLLLTDYKMPGMNGLELTRELRSFDEGKTAVIVLTGYNWDIIDEDARRDGVDGIIAKPLYADSLLQQIHNVLLHRSGIEPAEAEEEPAKESSLAGRRILIVEDVEQNAEILQDLLEIEDVLTEHAENGAVALEMFGKHPAGYYDAILMDMRMPVMDGITATRAIRALERPDAATIPIIAMTANVFDDDVESTRKAGMNAHLGKPVEPERLYDTLARIMPPRV